jgi:hypothetical protein
LGRTGWIAPAFLLAHSFDHLVGDREQPGWHLDAERPRPNTSMGKNYIETIWGRGYVLREPTGNEAKISA